MSEYEDIDLVDLEVLLNNKLRIDSTRDAIGLHIKQDELHIVLVPVNDDNTIVIVEDVPRTIFRTIQTIPCSKVFEKIKGFMDAK